MDSILPGWTVGGLDISSGLLGIYDVLYNIRPVTNFSVVRYHAAFNSLIALEIDFSQSLLSFAILPTAKSHQSFIEKI